MTNRTKHPTCCSEPDQSIPLNLRVQLAPHTLDDWSRRLHAIDLAINNKSFGMRFSKGSGSAVSLLIVMRMVKEKL
ncbi:unnamed protein product [Pieris brassicae]|uniref:Uncharacterized protein n=1 Tax=Pieris brassicae TaxID=7116 RepID=A0A9P0TL50_PIEBR|nr:unnamed protein product [Pieris brassicae]